MNENTPPPGWFPDPTDGHQLRWWDGQVWTDHTAPLTQADSSQESGPAEGQGSATAQPVATRPAGKKPWYLRWWAIAAAVIVALSILGSLMPGEGTPETTASSSGAAPKAKATTPSPEPEPVDTDGDGVNDDEDFRPKDPKVRTQDDVDTDKDGVPDHKDAFPKNAKFSKDTDGDGVPDQRDDFPKDPEFSKDTDGDGVADSEDAFPKDKSRSEITLAMENALEAAEDYLDYSAFSRKGLIDQLSSDYGSGFEAADAKWAVANVEANWKKQAVRAAKDYLDYSSFSRQGLIDQLSSPYGSQFTVEEATYAVDKIGL